MQQFTVNQVAKMANVSVRTLHHYDKINLLKPLHRSEAGYRYYGEKELYRLQQILLYRELDFPLSTVAEILDDPGFDLLAALREHRLALKARKNHITILLQTVEKTIQKLNQPGAMSPQNTIIMNYEDLYKGFSKEKAKAYRKEAAERWGEDTIKASEQKLTHLGKDNWEALQQRADALYTALKAAIGQQADTAAVQALIAQHYELMRQHFNITPEIYLSLGNMYVEDPRFKASFDSYDARLAEFLRAAIGIFVKAA